MMVIPETYITMMVIPETYHDDGYSRNVPDDGYVPEYVPDDGYSRNVP